jgi:NADH-quinone oxidoreductase subunit J
LNTILFLLLSLMSVGCAIMVVVRKSPVDSALFLLLTMVSLAGHYVMLNAPFLAAVQLIVYGGAVIIVFMFVIMLLNLQKKYLSSRMMPRGRWPYALIGALLMFCLTGLFRDGGRLGVASTEEFSGTIETFGIDLFQRWVYPFELTSILLLAAIVGAVALTRKTTVPKEDEHKEVQDA